MTNLIEAMATHFETLGQYHDMENPQYRRGIARAALTAIEAAGYRVVPVELTTEMTEAGAKNLVAKYSIGNKVANDTYTAMLAAALTD